MTIKLDPERIDKKDHIFMEFFSMYGNNFIAKKKKGKRVGSL
jgi:hypothetical protein